MGFALGVPASVAMWNAVLVAGLVGYLLGAVLAELSWARPRRAGAQLALLAPRRLHTYAPAWLVIAPWGVVGLTTAAVPAMAQLQPLPGAAGQLDVTVGLTLLAAGIATLTAATAWLIVHRPQPFTAAEALALDDAMRSTSVSTTLGSGLAAVLLILAEQLVRFGLDNDAAPPHTGWLALGCAVAALAAWIHLAHPAGRLVGRLPARP